MGGLQAISAGVSERTNRRVASVHPAFSFMKRISREQFLAFLSQYYGHAQHTEGADVGVAFRATFEMGHDDADLHCEMEEQDRLDLIEDRYVEMVH